MANNSDFTIQLGTYVNFDEAQKSIEKFKQKALQVEVIKLGKNSEQIKNFTKYVDEAGNTYERFSKTIQSSNGELNKVYDLLVKTSDGANTVKANFSRAEASLQNWNKNLSTDVAKVVTGFDKLGEITEKVRPTITTTEQFTDKFGVLTTKVSQLSKSGREVVTTTKEWTGAFGENVKEVEVYDATLKRVLSTDKQINIGTKQNKANTEQLTTKVKQLTSEVKRLTKENERLANSNNKVTNSSKKLGQSFSDSIVKVTKFYLARLPIRAVQATITETTKTVKEFNDAFTELAKVSDLSGDALRDYVDTLDEIGERVARTRTELVEALTTATKAGFTGEDSKIITEYSA